MVANMRAMVVALRVSRAWSVRVVFWWVPWRVVDFRRWRRRRVRKVAAAAVKVRVSRSAGVWLGMSVGPAAVVVMWWAACMPGMSAMPLLVVGVVWVVMR